MKKKLNVLVVCERSGKVREAFRKRGHNAYSCDLVPADDNSPYHYIRDALLAIKAPWDLLIAHPTCTYLCNSGVSWLYEGPSGHNAERWAALSKAIAFFNELKWADHIPFRALENPIPHGYAVSGIGRYNQLIQPYMFGHAESKATCLWLHNLPKLVPTNDVKARWKSLPKKDAQRLHYLSPSPQRARLRSETFQGIADAMAEQWGDYVSKQL